MTQEEQPLVRQESRNPVMVVTGEEEDRIYVHAQRAFGGGLVPWQKGDTPDGKSAIMRAYCCMMLGAELGLTRMQSLANIAVVNNRPSIMTKLKLGMCTARANFEVPPHKEESGSIDGGDYEVVWRCKRNGVEHEGRFSLGDAGRAGLFPYKNRDGVVDASAAWNKYPKDQVSHRACARMLDVACSDVLMGVASTEVMYDIIDVPRSRLEPVPPPALPAPMQEKEECETKSEPKESKKGDAQKPSAAAMKSGPSSRTTSENTGSAPVAVSVSAGPNGASREIGEEPSPSPRPAPPAPTPPRQERRGPGKMASPPPPVPSAKPRSSPPQMFNGLPDLPEEKPTAVEWKQWEALSGHLLEEEHMEIKHKIGAKVTPDLRRTKLDQAVKRAKFHLGSEKYQRILDAAGL